MIACVRPLNDSDGLEEELYFCIFGFNDYSRCTILTCQGSQAPHQQFWWHITHNDGPAHSLEVALIFTEIVVLLFSNNWEVGILEILEVGDLKLSRVSTQSTINGAL